MRLGPKLIVKVVGGLSLAGLAVALSMHSRQAVRDVNIGAPVHIKKIDQLDLVQEKVSHRRKMASVIGIKLPPSTTVLSNSEETTGGLKKTIIKLESWESPDDLQIYFTDLLLKDWMIMRDDLTPGVGWSGVFLQIEPIDRNLGIFAVVHKMGAASGPNNPTRITIMAGQAVK